MPTQQTAVTRLNNGMNPHFERGRIYERSETYAQIQTLLSLTDNEQLRNILHAWGNELIETLPVKIVTVEETYIVL